MAQFGGLQGLGAPINYYDTMIPDFRREALQETQNRVGQQQVIASQMQNQQAQRDNQRRQDFYTAIESATPDQLPALRRQFPEFAQNIQQEIGIQSAEHASFVHGALNDLSVAAASGNPQAVQSAIQKNGPALSSLGVSQEQAAQLYQQDPQRFNSLLNATRLATLPMDKQFDVQQKQQQLDETARNNDLENSRVLRGQNIAAANSAADRQIRLMQLKQDALTKQAANETNDLKRQELQQKIDANQQALQEKQQQKKMSLDYASEAASLAREIASDSSLGDITGSISSRVPTLYDSSQDLINKANRLQSLLTQDNLKLMNGVLTDRDITFLGNIASGLNITENGIKGSKDGVQKRLNAIASKLDDKLSAAGYSPQQKQLSDDELISKYAGGE
ncbi:DNA transfer protein [Citrobacter sp. Cb018]|uniref:phage DNA ejection protein n=1 Tax=Citrobacter sp. Cb018 TaxID=2985016 RepID=UPI00257B309E|nr:phage DNA ejection protein [Citrobacter sp. Cb018]MDM3413781.1 DNA transfer protein [Citrobacter sp. Cb018]